MCSRRLRRRSRASSAAVLAGLCLSLSVGLSVGPLSSAALGDPDPSVPSRQDVVRARAEAAAKARDVGAIEGRLVLAEQRLQQAAVSAEQASEAYNGAVWRRQQAAAAYRAARAEAVSAGSAVASQRTRIGALVAQSYQQGGELSALHAMLGADGPEGVLDQYAGFQGASSSLEADYQRFAASDSLAEVFERKAAVARAEQVRLAQAARAARDASAAAAQAAQSEAAAVATQRARLVRELAQAQSVSVSLARTRQTALEEQARRRAQARARRAAAAAAAAAAATPAPTASPDPASPSSPASGPAPAPDPDPAPRAAPAPAAAAAPAPAPAPSSSGGARQAVAFALAQVGDPYVWAAAGPGSWDCSGLTMGAWASAGRSLPHYSVAQYAATTPISAADLRPGDLVFWSSNGSPSGIHHVAMYIGNGRIVHAPRTGRPVSVDDMYYWVPPTFFGRV